MPYVTEYTQVTIIIPVVASKQGAGQDLPGHLHQGVFGIQGEGSSHAHLHLQPCPGTLNGYWWYLWRCQRPRFIPWEEIHRCSHFLVECEDNHAISDCTHGCHLAPSLLQIPCSMLPTSTLRSTMTSWIGYVWTPLQAGRHSSLSHSLSSTQRSSMQTLLTLVQSISASRSVASMTVPTSMQHSTTQTTRRLVSCGDEKHPGVGTDHIQSDEDLFDMFLNCKLHVFRAVDPAMKQHYQKRVCRPTMTEDRYHRCLASRADGLASRSQLAVLIFQQQQQLKQQQRLWIDF